MAVLSLLVNLLIAQRSLMRRGKNAMCSQLLHRPKANGCRDAVFIHLRFVFLPPNSRAFYPLGHPSTNPRSFLLYLSPSRRPPLLFPLCSSPLFASTCVLSSHSFPWSPPLAPTRSSLPAIAMDGPQAETTTSLGSGLAQIRPPSPWSSSIRCALLP